eukprot:Rhum_TRINITY_DN9682_c0_g1::Rhum_TRINITY_DN9682_c0_g1_i1::g.34661::m.34661
MDHEVGDPVEASTHGAAPHQAESPRLEDHAGLDEHAAEEAATEAVVATATPAAPAEPEAEEEEESEEEDTYGGAIPEYWIPGEDEQGLLESVSQLPQGHYVYLHSRPVQELRANFAEFTGDWVDLCSSTLLRGRTYALQESAKKLKDTDICTVESATAKIRAATRNEYLVVKYRDWSRWSAVHFCDDARGGFGTPKEGPSYVPFVINPFRRSYVDKYFLVCLNPGPGYFVPITMRQYVYGVIHTRENKLKGSNYLTEEQFAALMLITSPDRDPSSAALKWSTSLGVGTWARSQRTFAAAALLLSFTELLGGHALRGETPAAAAQDAEQSSEGGALRSALRHVSAQSVLPRLYGALRVLWWIGAGFASSVAGRILANRGDEAFVTADAPLSALSAGVISLTTETSATLWTFSAFSFLANYRVAMFY